MHPTTPVPSRAARSGVPAALAATGLLGCALTLAVHLATDLTLGSGVPDIAFLGLVLLFGGALPLVGVTATLLTFAVQGTRRLAQGQPATLRTTAALTGLAGSFLAAVAPAAGWQVLGLAVLGLCLLSVGLSRGAAPAIR